MWPFKKRPSYDVENLAKLLAYTEVREEFLGVAKPVLPQPAQVAADAARLVRYSESRDYQIFAKEAWSRALSNLDAMLEEKSSPERVQYHRGALKEALDLLRLSHQARATTDVLKTQSATLPR